MNKYYLMDKIALTKGTIIYQESHFWFATKQGQLFPKNFDEEGPLICEIDEETTGGIMHTFYTSPAIIGAKEFYRDLLAAGIDNIEIKPVIIKDTVNNVDYNNYLLLNFLGRISCADMNKSEFQSIDEGMNLIDTLVIDSEKVRSFNLFLVDEDTDCIVISESAYLYLSTRGYKDVFFEEIKQV